jgi:hypothetical protein
VIHKAKNSRVTDGVLESNMTVRTKYIYLPGIL